MFITPLCNQLFHTEWQDIFSLMRHSRKKEELKKYIEDNTDLWKSYVEELPISSIGSTIGTHTGPGGICVAFFSKTNS